MSGYEAPRYGGQPYGQAGYGQGRQFGQQFAPAGGSGPSPYLARPGSVVTAAVLGFVYGACGLLVCVVMLAGGAFLGDLAGALQQTDPTVGEIGSGDLAAARAVLLLTGAVALAWTVVMVWGGTLALRGRSRVLLLVGAAIAVAVTGLLAGVGLLGAVVAPDGSGQAGGIVLLVVVFLGTVAMLVLLCVRSAARFFAAHRDLRRA